MHVILAVFEGRQVEDEEEGYHGKEQGWQDI